MHVENLENRVRTDGRIDRQTLAHLRAAPTSAKASSSARARGAEMPRVGVPVLDDPVRTEAL
jgi:hypothetical protein